MPFSPSLATSLALALKNFPGIDLKGVRFLSFSVVQLFFLFLFFVVFFFFLQNWIEFNPKCFLEVELTEQIISVEFGNCVIVRTGVSGVVGSAGLWWVEKRRESYPPEACS